MSSAVRRPETRTIRFHRQAPRTVDPRLPEIETNYSAIPSVADFRSSISLYARYQIRRYLPSRCSRSPGERKRRRIIMSAIRITVAEFRSETAGSYVFASIITIETAHTSVHNGRDPSIVSPETLDKDRKANGVVAIFSFDFFLKRFDVIIPHRKRIESL